jgi:hypothetical protein
MEQGKFAELTTRRCARAQVCSRAELTVTHQGANGRSWPTAACWLGLLSTQLDRWRWRLEEPTSVGPSSAPAPDCQCQGRPTYSDIDMIADDKGYTQRDGMPYPLKKLGHGHPCGEQFSSDAWVC